MAEQRFKTVQLGDLLTLQRGFDLPEQNREAGCIPIVSSGGVSGLHSQSRVNGPGIVTGRYGSIGRVFFVEEPFWPLNTTLFVSDFKGNDPRFCFHVLSTIKFDKFKDKTGVPGVNRNDLHKLPVHLPPVDSQAAISSLLDRWCDAEATVDELLGANRTRLRGLMQQLLTGRRRLPAFAGEAWEEVPIGSVMREDDRPVEWNDDELYELVSVRRWAGGVYTRDQLHGRDIKVKKLKRIKAGDILISHIQSAYGAMAMVGDDHDGHCVSELYTVLVPQDGSRVEPRFFAWLCRTKWMWHQALVASNGFKAERLRINFDPSSFLNLMIDMPSSIDEQRAIADILDTAQREIELLEQLREQIQLQKRGLMQKLLTGEIRVPAEANA